MIHLKGIISGDAELAMRHTETNLSVKNQPVGSTLASEANKFDLHVPLSANNTGRGRSSTGLL